MYNEAPLIKRQREILHRANTLITIYERDKAKIEETLDREMVAARRSYERTEAECSKRKQQVEQWKKHIESFSKTRSLNGGTPQTLSFSTQSPLRRIDDSIEIATQQHHSLESSMQSKSRPPLVIALFSLAIISFITMSIGIIVFNTANISPLPAGTEAAFATSTAVYATSIITDSKYSSAQATANAAITIENTDTTALATGNVNALNALDNADATAAAAGTAVAVINNQKVPDDAHVQQAASVASDTVARADTITWIVLSLILTIIFFSSALAVRYRSRRRMQANWRNQYATISSALESATSMLQKLRSETQIDYDRQLNENKQQAQARREQLQQTLVEDFAHLNNEVIHHIQSMGLLGADWQDRANEQDASRLLTMPSASENVIRCGKLALSYQQQRLQPFPFFISFPAGQHVLLQAPGDSYEQATMFLQSLLLRLVTTQLPGMIRFTFFDPLYFGQHIAPFMQLGTYDPTLVGNRIWTESSHIEQQLVSLSEYLAQVNQQYLWGATSTVEAYNQQNPHRPLPYRMLVILGFPIKFSPEAVRTLLTIARNGPRCGVYAIILCDMEQLSASGIALRDFAQTALTLRWEGQQVVWDGMQSIV